MSVNETIMANKSRRSRTLLLLLVVLFSLSIICLPACSDNDNNTGSQRVVHVTVNFEDEGLAAVAWVQDGTQNFVSDATLSINDRPFELTVFGDEASDEDSAPIYSLELHDLKGGDSLTLVAKRSDGTLIYAPPSAQIPMALELVEPSVDQPIIPGEEVVVRWAGGEGASHIAAFYADDLGEEQYWNVQKYGDVESITIPPGIIREAGGIIGGAALSGDHPSFKINTSADPLESSFIVYRDQAIVIPDQRALTSHGSCPPGQYPGHSGACCPNSPMGKTAAGAICTTEFVAIIGAIVWGVRSRIDRKEFAYCEKYCCGPAHITFYCVNYSSLFSHWKWQRGCVCPQYGP